MRLSQIVTLALTPLVLGLNVPGRVQTFLTSDSPLDDSSSQLTDYIVDKRFSLLQLHRRLVSTESISDNELSVSKWLLKYLEDAGLTVETQQVLDDPKNYNVYAYLGKKRDCSLLLTSHIDTVPPYIPYHVKGTEIHGRGTCDAKGSVATQIIAFLDLVKRGDLKEGDVALLFVVGEETKGFGMRKALESLGASWDAAIFGEPTENKLGVGHKGILVFQVIVEGKASHSGYPELGISATEILIPILSKLQQLDLPKSDLLGPSTLNIGQIEAGVAFNVVPAYAKASIAIRVAADAEKTIKLIKGAVEGVEHVKSPEIYCTEPQYLDYEVPGFESIILAYTTDIPNLTIPLKQRYLYGPGSIHVAHGDDEFVENQDLLDAVDGYKKLIEYVLDKQ
ncbi:hypothetical protein PUMCH_000291 [Australozyma saopauloensis]|uniref:Peptidase M20 dimerisation domain-containing protein n=1 Tax=Australozyma saopauloensis TaxID=291208 RepID=A0AAX4H505_9ASCO|nr:hypothetical protein PUMCH_000291 [[Candida] saopauloensis]